ncbi:g984 [Coccomyxa viridis]|uniref:G984 protein n=1 Tax=Coccomyxa viridis TaxID=1274662 RepID=A0ABP1FKR4_9CHLO
MLRSCHITHLTRIAHLARGAATSSEGQQWKWLQDRGHVVNPCNSRLHPAFSAGMAVEGEELSVQTAYTPDSHCFGCGPAADDGLHLKSFRVENGLSATVQLPSKYQAFPGIINGGIVSSLFDCHGNWTAAIALMDKAKLPRPPLTLTAELLVRYREATPPNEQLVVRSSVVSIKENTEKIGGGKPSVQVDITLHKADEDGSERLLATATGIFKKLGALRAL